MTLLDATVNKVYIIKNIKSEGNSKRRLLDIGFTKGSSVYVAGAAPMGGAILVALRGSLIALRSDAAASVEVANGI